MTYKLYSGVFSKLECDEIIERGNKLPIRPSRVAVGVENKVRTSTNAFFVDKSLTHNQKLFHHIRTNSTDLTPIKIESFESPQFAKYTPGQFYNWHIDYYLETRKFLGSDRILSSSVLLNDEFSGGDFQFRYGDNDIHKIDMKIGDIIVFHAKTFHCVTPIESGTRYSLVMWTLGKGDDSTKNTY